MTFGRRISGIMRGGRAFLRRLAGETRGNVAMIFGLSLPVLILMTVGGVDIHRASTVRVNLQDALDAAALHAARSPYTSNTDIQRVGLAALKANLKAYPQIRLREADTTFVLNSDDVVIANSKVDVKTLVANIFLPPYGKFMDDYIAVGAHSEVDRSSRNVEVALVLDVTGSMALDNRIVDLKAAAKDLVDIVVQDVQTPYYSKVAIVPYSMAVNVDTYANAARGSIIGSTNITGAAINLTGPQRTITAATKARPVVITSNGHGFVNGDVVWVTGVNGMTALNNKAFLVANKTTNTFELYTLSGSRVDGRNYSTYSSGGRVQKCQNNDCSITITSNSHGLSNNEYVYITDVGGMTEINNQTYLVGNVTTNTFTIDPNASSLTPYTSGGKSWCARYGCTYYTFENVYDDLLTHRVSTCVTERTGGNAYTDISPSSSRVGLNYPSTSNPCLTSTVRPLSSTKSTIKSNIDALVASGSTGGHVGVAWGWYTLSPNFSLFGSATAAPYNTADTLKAVVIMTDGEYNSGYCNGVIARNSTSGSGSDTLHINCDAPNGHPFDQTLAMCAAMKRAGVVVYTVGFKVVDDERARRMVNECATSASYVHMANSGTALSEAFRAIGRDITQLRISK